MESLDFIDNEGNVLRRDNSSKASVKAQKTDAAMAAYMFRFDARVCIAKKTIAIRMSKSALWANIGAGGPPSRYSPKEENVAKAVKAHDPCVPEKGGRTRY